MNNSDIIDLTGRDADASRGKMTGPSSRNKEQPIAGGDGLGHSNASSQAKRRFPEPVFTPVIFFNSALRMRKMVDPSIRRLKPEIKLSNDLQKPGSGAGDSYMLPLNQTT